GKRDAAEAAVSSGTWKTRPQLATLPPMTEHSSLDVPRVVRAPTARLLAFRGEHWIDLEAWLRDQGAPAGMRERLGASWFSLARLIDALEDPKAQRVEPIALDGSTPLLPPLLPSEARQILALGKNFRAHAAEFGEEVPEEPLVFAKLPG